MEGSVPPTIRSCIWKQGLLAALFVLLCFAMATSAFARTAYVGRSTSTDLTMVDFATGPSDDYTSPSTYQVRGATPAGGSVRGIAIAPDGSNVYVGNYFNDTLGVIRTSDDLLDTSIPLLGGGSWRYPAVTPDGGHVYISNYFLNNVAVIRTSDNSVETYVPVGSEPRGIAISPDGSRVFVANFGGADDISVIDTSTDTVIQTFPVPGADGMYDISITPDGRTLFAGQYYPNELWAIRASDGAVLDTISVGSEPHGVAIGPEGDRVYVTNQLSGNLSIIDSSDPSYLSEVAGSPVSTAPGSSPEDVAISPDGKRALVTSIAVAGNRVCAVDTVNIALITCLAVGNDPWGIAITPNQRPIAGLSVADGTVGTPITLDASSSTDTDGSIVGYDWTFGDGTTSQTSTAMTTHTYSTPGTYSATVTVTDNEGAADGTQGFTGQGAYFYSPGQPSATVPFTVSAASSGDDGSTPATQKVETRLTAGFVKKKRVSKSKRAKGFAKSKTYTVRHATVRAGKKMALRGTLKTKSGGRAVSGMTVHIQRRPVYSKKWRNYKWARTNSKGRYSVVARAKVTSHLRSVFRGTDGFDGTRAYTRLSKRPIVSLNVSSRAKSGTSLRISGRVKGASKRAVPVALQFKRSSGGWQTFHMVSTKKARFSTNVRLAKRSIDYSIRLRAKVYSSFGKAFRSARSRSAKVQITVAR